MFTIATKANGTGTVREIAITPATTLTVNGILNVTGIYKANGVSGVASFGPSVVTSITVVNGIITAIS